MDPEEKQEQVGLKARPSSYARWKEAASAARVSFNSWAIKNLDAAALGVPTSPAQVPNDPEFEAALTRLLLRLPVGSPAGIIRACVILVDRADREGSGLLGTAPKPGPRKS